MSFCETLCLTLHFGSYIRKRRFKGKVDGKEIAEILNKILK